MGDMDQETDWDRLFKAARQAHESGKLNQALELYAAVSRQNPYYPGLEGHMRALEVQMTHGHVSDQPAQRSRAGESRGGEPATGYSRPSQATQGSSGCINPYLFYGIIAFLPPIILTLLINSAMPENWEWLFTWLVVQNVMTFLIYGYDKLIAPSGIMRVPDSILLLEVVTGAFVGAPLACELFRHKTQKLPFRQKFWIAEIVSVAWVAIYYLSLILMGGTLS